VKATFAALTQRAQKPVLVTLVIGLGLALGLGGAALVWRDDDNVKLEPSATDVELPAHIDQPGPRSITDEAPPAPTTEPSTARDALVAFLQAQVDARDADAYALITNESRSRFPTLANWQTATVDRLVPLAFELQEERAADVDRGQAVDIELDARHAPALDPFSGLVPGRARETWRVWRENDHWRVDPDPIAANPILPLDEAAQTVVRSWVDRVRACDADGARALQLSSLLYGPISLGDAPCKERGEWKVWETTRFADAPDTGDYVAAFGPGISRWGRLVPVEGPRSSFLAAVGPLGDEWRVLGVLVDGNDAGR
jgi:hypothetical protein